MRSKALEKPSGLIFSAVAFVGLHQRHRRPGGGRQCGRRHTRTSKRRSGFVPGFFKAFPESGIAGAWSEFKSVQLSSGRPQLNAKTKELIGLAVTSRIPCAYCVYFHTAVAKANGASGRGNSRSRSDGGDLAVTGAPC